MPLARHAEPSVAAARGSAERHVGGARLRPEKPTLTNVVVLAEECDGAAEVFVKLVHIDIRVSGDRSDTKTDLAGVAIRRCGLDRVPTLTAPSSTFTASKTPGVLTARVCSTASNATST